MAETKKDSETCNDDSCACPQTWRISADLRPLVTSFCARCQGTGPTCIVDQLVEAVDEAGETEDFPASTAAPGDVRLSGFGPGRA